MSAKTNALHQAKRVSYQLTVEQRINLLVEILKWQGHRVLARGNWQKITEAKSVSDTAVSKFAKRLQAVEPPHKIVWSNKIGNQNSIV